MGVFKYFPLTYKEFEAVHSFIYEAMGNELYVNSPFHRAIADLPSEYHYCAIRKFTKTLEQQHWLYCQLDPERKKEFRFLETRFFGKSYMDGYIRAFVTNRVNDSYEELIESCGFYPYNNDLGRPFGGMPCIKRTKTRVLITQQCGWDV